jgi:hypothetical protein
MSRTKVVLVCTVITQHLKNLRHVTVVLLLLLLFDVIPPSHGCLPIFCRDYRVTTSDYTGLGAQCTLHELTASTQFFAWYETIAVF